jgi:hypothetical protein
VPNRYRSLAGAAQAAAQSDKRRIGASYTKEFLALTAQADTERPAIMTAKRRAPVGR